MECVFRSFWVMTDAMCGVFSDLFAIIDTSNS